MKMKSSDLFVLQVFLIVCSFILVNAFIPDKGPRMAVLSFLFLYMGGISGYQFRKREEETKNLKPKYFVIGGMAAILIAFIVTYKLGI
jgi:hypothetical protein